MSTRRRAAILSVIALAALLLIRAPWRKEPAPSVPTPPLHVESPAVPREPVPEPGSERLLDGYGDPSTPPIEDLRKIHRVATGYFSVMKDPSRFPIGGNADLAAALAGENANREVFVRKTHPAFNGEGLIKDRWGNPLIVHPEGWRQLELRSTGPDGIGYNEDDVVLSPTGVQTSK